MLPEERPAPYLGPADGCSALAEGGGARLKDDMPEPMPLPPIPKDELFEGGGGREKDELCCDMVGLEFIDSDDMDELRPPPKEDVAGGDEMVFDVDEAEAHGFAAAGVVAAEDQLMEAVVLAMGVDEAGGGGANADCGCNGCEYCVFEGARV